MAPPKSKIGNLLVEIGKPEKSRSGKTTSPEFRNKIAKDGFMDLKSEGIETLYDVFASSVKKYPKNECLGWRPTKEDGSAGPFKWITYEQTAKKVEQVASGLVQVGLQPKGRVGVFGTNSPEWMTTMQACNRQSLYCVPLYDSLGENAIEFIINHSESTIVFAASDKLAKLASALPHPGVLDLVKTVVYWGLGDKTAVAEIEKLGVKAYAFEEFMALGREHPTEPVPPGPEDYCTIMYTSGTTGDPKGVLLTHRAVVSVAAATKGFLNQIAPNVNRGESINEKDCILSYLPLAHIFDRAAEETFLYLGAKIGYWRGDIKGLVDDISELRPTVFIGVPRVFDRIYTGVMSKIQAAGGLKACLFNWGFKRKLHFIEAGYPQHQAAPLFDKVVFSKVKQRLGGRVKLIITGGAPLARHVEDFLKVVFCCPVVQGYGLTETCAASFIAVPDQQDQAGTVGPPMPCLGLRLESVPEMNYDATAKPPQGEVCLRGAACFSGYYKQEEKTAEVLDPDGWFHTGDIGEITEGGGLRIIDRMKNIFKLSQGEYIAVEKVESVFKKTSLVEQIWVYGNSYESQLVAVVVPNEEKIKAWAKSKGIAADNVAGICKNPKATEHVLKELTATGKEGKLKGFELIKGVHLEPEQFSIEEDLMTPTFKLKRPQLQKKYQEPIDALYNKIRN